jgi:hypothetical protein
MAMYVHLLSAVLLSDKPSADVQEELLAVARTRRDEMLASTSPSHDRASAERSLAYDVNYDAALIALCAVTGIDATPASFGRPREERARLERALALAGLDLAVTGSQQLPGPG